MTAYNIRNLLVTGGAGFIGANFIHYIQKVAPYINIINLDALTYAGSKKNLERLLFPDRHTFIEGNICHAELVQDIFKKYSIDTVAHFAAESHVDRSISGPAEFIQTNVVGTFILLETAKHIWLDQLKLDQQQCRFHHISTDEVYGSLLLHDPAFTEKTAYTPNSPYSASKASSDHLVRAYSHTYGLPTTVSHCSNNYGPFQHEEKLIPKIIKSCLTWQPITIYGDGTHIRDWLYVEDHCHALFSIIKDGNIGQTYNVGGCNEWSNIEIAKYICQRLDELKPNKEPYANLIQFVGDRLGHDWRYAIDMSKIKQELNWQPQETFSTGIEKTLNYYLTEVF